jgi:hypothetical protein
MNFLWEMPQQRGRGRITFRRVPRPLAASEGATTMTTHTAIGSTDNRPTAADCISRTEVDLDRIVGAGGDRNGALGGGNVTSRTLRSSELDRVSAAGAMAGGTVGTNT